MDKLQIKQFCVSNTVFGHEQKLTNSIYSDNECRFNLCDEIYHTLYDIRLYRDPSSGMNINGYVSGGRAIRASGIANRAVAFTSYLCSMPASSTSPNPETSCCPMHVLFPVLNGRKYSGFLMYDFPPGL